jgi:hypothetical protein
VRSARRRPCCTPSIRFGWFEPMEAGQLGVSTDAALVTFAGAILQNAGAVGFSQVLAMSAPRLRACL